MRSHQKAVTLQPTERTDKKKCAALRHPGCRLLRRRYSPLGREVGMEPGMGFGRGELQPGTCNVAPHDHGANKTDHNCVEEGSRKPPRERDRSQV
ncbi:hypothetical protein PBY51_012189 [Eleginops maclovinus]|uniref:Uncharacterized protein n=1 Tax=Eleginops maclovinus TaxID=56733 RepID=A0AAN7XW35_ELEMC|nr:hypothetical protein PBY51_012189 [Eleginops maclovinus]